MTLPAAFSDIIIIREGRFVLAGSRSLIIDGNGTVVRDFSLPSTSFLEAGDGNLYLEQSGAPYNLASVFRFDVNGTMTGTWPVGSGESGTISSMQENGKGDLKVLYTFWNPQKNRQDIMFRESELVTLGKGGNLSGMRSLVAVGLSCRTPEGGFAFLAYPFPHSTAYTTLPHTGGTLHMVWLSPEGAVTRDKPLGLPAWVAPEEIIRTRDGGLLTVIMPGR